jgi:hypothetical protein
LGIVPKLEISPTLVGFFEKFFKKQQKSPKKVNS